MSASRIGTFVLVVSPYLLTTGCASAGATLNSGVGDAFLEHPPFYAGADPASLDAEAPLGYFPVAYQRGASQPAIFDPGEASLEDLLRQMSGYLAETGVAVALWPGETSGAPAGLLSPDVRFGCVTESGVSDDDCAEREEGAMGRGKRPMHLAMGRPSGAWIAWADELMAGAGVEQALVLTVEVGQYWIRQRGLRGTKEVELGTNHVVRFPWLTSLEGSVAVVQLTGALVGRDGKALRIGAEGLLARRTGMTVSVLGAQSLVTDDEIRQLATARREDLPGRPLVWQAALRSLVEQLSGRDLPAIRAQQS